MDRTYERQSWPRSGRPLKREDDFFPFADCGAGKICPHSLTVAADNLPVLRFNKAAVDFIRCAVRKRLGAIGHFLKPPPKIGMLPELLWVAKARLGVQMKRAFGLLTEAL